MSAVLALRAARPPAADAVVELRDAARLSAAERGALLDSCRIHGAAVYAGARLCDGPGVLRLAAQLGLGSLDPDPLAEADGVARIAIDRRKAAAGFGAFTEARMLWHTDGYYYPPGRRIGAVVLHCVRPAAQGGEVRLFDPALAWQRLQEADPRLARALLDPEALTICGHTAADGSPRPAVGGPVFSIDPGTGAVRARFTARRRGVRWKADATVSEAAARLLAILDRDPAARRVPLEAGMGIVCGNVFRARTAFTDDPACPRLLLRARFVGSDSN